MKPDAAGPLLFVMIAVVLLASCDVRLVGGTPLTPSGETPRDTSPDAAPGHDRAAAASGVGVDLYPRGDG